MAVDYDRIKKDCFWDYDFTNEEIDKMAKSENIRESSFLFQKILLNSTRVLLDLRIFKDDVLKDLIESYRVPEFNNEYIFRRKNIAEVYFLDKPVLVNELKWIV